MTTSHLALFPRDGFFCKDGRGWHGGAAGAGHGLDWPWPSTLRGAVRTLWGRAHEPIVARQGWPAATAAVTLGASLPMWRAHGGGPLARRWPVPADVEYVPAAAGQPAVVRLLQPAPSAISTLGRDDDDARERLWIAPADARGKPGARPRWWTESELAAWLAGGAIAATPAIAADHPVRRRVTRLAIGPNQAAVDGALFSHDVVETVEPDGEWAIAAIVDAPDAQFGAIATLGSDRRVARVEPLPSDPFAVPVSLTATDAPDAVGLRLLVVTPTIFARGWLPDGLDARDGAFRGHLAGLGPEVVLRAAITARPVAISGWDMTAGKTGAPRSTNLAVAPGAVYFFHRADGAAFSAAELAGLWLAALGARCDDGFGRVIAAAWTSP